MRSRRIFRRFSSPTAAEGVLGLLCVLVVGCSSAGSNGNLPTPVAKSAVTPACRPSMLYAAAPGIDVDTLPEEYFRKHSLDGDLKKERFCVDLAVDGGDRVFFAGDVALKRPERAYYGSVAGELSAAGGLSRIGPPFHLRNFWDVTGAHAGAGFAITGDAAKSEWAGLAAPEGEVLARFDEAAKPIWVKSLNGRIQRARSNVLLDTAGNTIVFGEGDWNLRKSRIVVMKFDPRGELQWEKEVPGWPGYFGDFSPQNQLGVVRGDSIYLWYGEMSENPRVSRKGLVKLGPDGTEQWRKVIVESDVPAEDEKPKEKQDFWGPHLALDHEGNLWAAAMYRGVLRLSNGQVLEHHVPHTGVIVRGYTPAGAITLMKIDPEGKLLFARSFDAGQPGAFTNGLVVDAEDRVWLLGGYRTFVDFGTTRLERPSPEPDPDPPLVTFLAGFDKEGRAQQVYPLARGAGGAFVATKKGLVMTIQYTGDLLMKNVDGAPRYDSSYGCGVMYVPTGCLPGSGRD